jgi:hypothetical protein
MELDLNLLQKCLQEHNVAIRQFASRPGKSGRFLEMQDFITNEMIALSESKSPALTREQLGKVMEWKLMVIAPI